MAVRQRQYKADDMSAQLRETLGDLAALLRSSAPLLESETVPSAETFLSAGSWVTRLVFEVERSGTPWLRPHVVSNPAGEIVFTWEYAGRTLTVYVAGDSAEYVESWGIDITAEMSDGDADSRSTCRTLWLRLMRG